MAEPADLRLEALLRATLQAEVAALPVRVRPEDVMARDRERRRARAPGRMRLLVPAAAIFVGLVGLLTVGRLTERSTATYDAVIVRGLATIEGVPGISSDLEVVTARVDGSEQPLHRFAASRFPPGTVLSYAPMVSSSGALVFGVGFQQRAGEAEFLVDLARPDREPLLLSDADSVEQGGVGTVGWGPDGDLWRIWNWSLERIDPVTHVRNRVSWRLDEAHEPISTGTWRLIPAADGSGIVVGPYYLTRLDATASLTPESWGVVSPDGRLTPGFAAVMDGIGRRLLSPDNGEIKVCDSDPDSYTHCPDQPWGTVMSGPKPDGKYRTWGMAASPDEFVLDASWAADGGIWLLIDRRVGGRTLALVHRDAQGRDLTRATLALPPRLSPMFDAFAPDDSLIALGWWDDETSKRTALIDPRSGRTYLHVGNVAAFVPPVAATAWPADPFTVQQGELVAAALPPGAAGPGYAPLPALSEQTMDMERVLFVHEEPATSSETGPPIVVELGPIELDGGLGISLVCSGPGDVSVTVIKAIGPERWMLRHCLDSIRTSPHRGRSSRTVRSRSSSQPIRRQHGVWWSLTRHQQGGRPWNPPPNQTSPAAHPWHRRCPPRRARLRSQSPDPAPRRLPEPPFGCTGGSWTSLHTGNSHGPGYTGPRCSRWPEEPHP